jgi:hypothetical protein
MTPAANPSAFLLPRRGEEARAESLRIFLPLPFGERVGVRGQPRPSPASMRAPIATAAGTRPPPQPPPRRGEEANAVIPPTGRT